METQEPLEYSEAIKIYEDILKLNPHSYIFVPLANAYLKTGMPEKAIEIAKEGLKEYPDFASARMVLARAYYDCQRIDEAKEESLGVLQSHSDNLLAYKLLVDIYLLKNNIEEAKKLIERLKDLDTKNLEIKGLISSLEKKLNQLRSQRPQAEINKEIESEEAEEEKISQDDISTKTLAKIYEEQGLLEKAIETYRKILRGSPENESILEKIKQLENKLETKGPQPEKPSDESTPQATEEKDEILNTRIDDREAIKEIRMMFPNEEEKEKPSSSEDISIRNKKVMNTLEYWLKDIESSKDK
ncbi:MAG TPA: tetratricopeptide repeat protein [Nitrospinota bacterium]|nr:tetratricopeptide repeat protein [Nitrospinota bacterium]